METTVEKKQYLFSENDVTVKEREHLILKAVLPKTQK